MVDIQVHHERGTVRGGRAISYAEVDPVTLFEG